MSGRINVHATGIVLGTAGLILRGPPGSGKSLLALALLDLWVDRGLEAWLVADDRLDLEAGADGVAMHAPARIAGMIELRGRGIVSRPSRPSARIDLVADLVESLERMPESAAFSTELMGKTLPRCPVPRLESGGGLHQVVLIREALSALTAREQKALE